ncbi:hypothetical protein Lalb_Chr16g0386141 [Lupinus albus]|uniref:Uncharacterized protein n=1 Tax=Lupinus albus TaxID=3870 RepID=A0A6A4P6M1_LUPAL|nr:hypothetical protein Lalb_Chr16g0386141 [Lupinus albus]
MVCTANDLQEWKDFPKGLKVLLLDGDINSASEISAKLLSMDYNGKYIIIGIKTRSLLLLLLYVSFSLLHLHGILA